MRFAGGQADRYGSPEGLSEAVARYLPANYDFEISKTLHRIHKEQAHHVGLQFPEGLLMFSGTIASILSTWCSFPVEITVLGDVTYGACCIDDLTGDALQIDLLVHYGHSCLVPLNQTRLKTLYVFVSISIDIKPLVEFFEAHRLGTLALGPAASPLFPPKPEASTANSSSSQLDPPPCSGPGSPQQPGSSGAASKASHAADPAAVLRAILRNKGDSFTVAIYSTIQYAFNARELHDALSSTLGPERVFIPQCKPLTPGEALGCTAQTLADDNDHPVVDLIIFIADGRFHLEAVLIANPAIPLYRYDPFLKTLSFETYDHQLMHLRRQRAIARGRQARTVGLVFGTLGRQGSVGLFERLLVKVVPLFISELNPLLMAKLPSIDAYIQIACPRLSLDWGDAFDDIPLLNPYEAYVAFDNIPYSPVYPMQYYADDGPAWTNYHLGRDGRAGSLFEPKSLAGRRESLRQKALARTQSARLTFSA